MSKVLMSIKPEYVEKILSGEKKYEYRKIKPKNNIDKIIIYSTFPVMKIVGEVDVIEIIEDTPEILWNKTKNESGALKINYDKYYYNKVKAVAYKLGNINKYKYPLKLKEIGLNYIPQSFIYLD